MDSVKKKEDRNHQYSELKKQKQTKKTTQFKISKGNGIWGKLEKKQAQMSSFSL